MNMHDEQLLKAQRAVEEQRGWVQQIAKKDNGIILCRNAVG